MANSYAYLTGKNVYNSEQLTISTTAVSGTTALVDNTARALGSQNKAAAAVIQALTNNILYTLDGSTPSGSNGKRLVAGDVLGLAGYSKIKKFKCVREGASDATIHIDYYN